jgi:hypothetical protein
MRIDRQVVVFDAADLAAESSFWAGVLDGTVDAEDDWHMVIVEGEPRVGVQLAPNHVPPDWPDGTPEQQIHLDLWSRTSRAPTTVSCRWVRKCSSLQPTWTPSTTSRSTRIQRGTPSACVGFNGLRSSRHLSRDVEVGRACQVALDAREHQNTRA